MKSNFPQVPYILSSTQNFNSANKKLRRQQQQYKSNSIIKSGQRKRQTFNPNVLNSNKYQQNELIKQLQAEYENISNYKINDNENKKIKKSEKIGFINLQAGNNGRVSQQQIERKVMEQNPNIRRQNQENQYLEPQVFRDIKQSNTIEDQDGQDLEQQSPLHLKSNKQYINIQNKKQFKLQPRNITIQKEYSNRYSHNFNQSKNQENLVYSPLFTNFPKQALQHKIATKNKNNKVYTTKHSANNGSGKSQSNHPVFRDTLQYVDTYKYDLSNNVSQYNRYSRPLSEDSSQSEAPKTIYDPKQSYRFKYKKYKQKYFSLIEVIHQMQSLNQTLIKDQRQNYNYYENTIKSLQNLLGVKDKQIQQLNDSLSASHNNQRLSNICSIQGRQHQIENQKLKRDIQSKNKQIKSLKQNISSLDQSFQQVTQKSHSGTNKSIQKKILLLTKSKESMQKKIKALEEINSMYEQKLKQKQNRIGKLSSFNSQLQQDIIKFKQKIHSQETNDTQRWEVGIHNLKKQKREQINVTNNSQNLTDRSLNKKVEIQNHLSCIDEQIQLIRGRMYGKQKNKENQMQQSYIFQKKKQGRQKNERRVKKSETHQLDIKSQFNLEDSIKQNQDEKDDNYIKELKNMVMKLENLRESIESIE